MEQPVQPTSSTEGSNDLQQRARAESKGSNKVTWGITIISSISLILTLLGYGVSLSVESMFGIPHQSIYSSVLDLIGLSVYAIVSVILGIDKITWIPILEQAWKPSLIMAAGMFLFICLLIHLNSRDSQVRGRVNQFCNYLKPQENDDSTGRLLGKATIGSLLFGCIVFIAPFLMIGSLMITVVLISVIPMFGMQLGGNYFREFVVTPTHCEPVKSRAALLGT